MFNQISSQKLRELARELAIVGEEETTTCFDQYPYFAKCLAVLMRTELAERSHRDESED